MALSTFTITIYYYYYSARMLILILLSHGQRKCTAVRVCSPCPICSTFSDTRNHVVGWLGFNVPFQHKYGYIRDERNHVGFHPEIGVITEFGQKYPILSDPCCMPMKAKRTANYGLPCIFTGSIARSANLPVFSLLRGQF